ncbi:MAG: Ig-like domain-containing protein [Balneolaceae bacterium]
MTIMNMHTYLCGWPLLLLLLASCATPIAPTGGPPDRTPPEIESTHPENETIRFDGREFEFRFSKFINRGSFQEALQVEPDLGIPYDVDLGRMSATVEFSRALPENTTIILRIGTELQDTRNNSLGAPYSLAVSTGDEIDDGVVTARFFSAESGDRLEGRTLFLYREPFDLSSRANYIAQSDTSGRVTLSYLAADRYRAIWVDDANRNRQWDRDRERAQPLYDEEIELGKGEELDLGRLHLQERPDTTAPTIEAVGLLTTNYFRLRASEELVWSDEARIVVTDTTGTELGEAAPLFLLPEDSAILMAQSDLDTDPETRYQLRLEGFRDLSGNPLQERSDPFSGSAEPDTIQTRIIGDNQLPGLRPDEPFIAGYNKRIVDPNITDSLRVVAGDQMIRDWPNVAVDGHRLIISPDDEWTSGRTWQFLIWNPIREQLRPIEPTIWQRGDMGGLDLTLEEPWQETEVQLRLESQDGSVRVDTSFTGGLQLADLPPLSYRITIFDDQNSDGRWNAGDVMPFSPPEPIRIYPSVPVQEGFDSELSLTLDRFDPTEELNRDAEPGDSEDGERAGDFDTDVPDGNPVPE